jgi:hypothetical protein
MVHESSTGWESDPLVPVTVTVYVPTAAVPGSRLSVAVPLAAIDAGETTALAPEGTW